MRSFSSRIRFSWVKLQRLPIFHRNHSNVKHVIEIAALTRGLVLHFWTFPVGVCDIYFEQAIGLDVFLNGLGHKLLDAGVFLEKKL